MEPIAGEQRGVSGEGPRRSLVPGNYQNIRAVIDAGVDMRQGVAVNDPALSKKDKADLRRGRWFPVLSDRF